MPTFEKRSGHWRARIIRRGITRTATFPTKQLAQAWVAHTQAEIYSAEFGQIPKSLTVSHLLKRYEAEISTHKKGARWESIRIATLLSDPISAVRLRDLASEHVQAWQANRMHGRKPASVRRERNLFQAILNQGRRWKLVNGDPFDGVSRPRDSKPRNRIATPAELAMLTKNKGSLSEIIEFAVETGLRCKEIANLREVKGRVAYIRDPKTGHDREVPLSTRAVELWTGGWGRTPAGISTAFRLRCQLLGIKGLTFHDLRHTACTRLAEKLEVLELCKMMGWRNPKFAMVYYNKPTEEIAKKLG